MIYFIIIFYYIICFRIAIIVNNTDDILISVYLSFIYIFTLPLATILQIVDFFSTLIIKVLFINIDDTYFLK